ncbi:phage tail protein, partial [Xenorhabdus sp. SGI240]
NLGLSDARFVIERGRNANGLWVRWSDGAIELMGFATPTDGLAIVNFPIALPEISPHISIAEYVPDAIWVNVAHTSMVISSTLTTTGFRVRCQMAAGGPSHYGFSWRLYYAPI